ncbi:YbhB/YbcL family Raf kinase inhibitor-like protein [Sporobolomyces koalae]|uniref:YbhB/YbcL family Raf kinase inhibitor-like protein n=1 Tax=Sporobolomyces koalae TaxID=500713 RepID=UPI00317FAA4F
MHRTRQSLRTFSRSLATQSSASSSASTYSAPLKAGVLPAYDHALAYIAQDRDFKLKQLEELKSNKAVDQAVLEKLEVEAWSNDPETRWKANNQQADLSKPVFRFLAERKWRKEGDLAILMQRVTQMSVTPDLLPEIAPEADLRIQIGEQQIVPGVFTKPAEAAQTRGGIEVTAQVYHPDERLYTLLLVDPDVPDEMNQSFTTFAHWIVPNIPLSATSPSVLPLSSLASALPFIPPHPQNGTPYHRYTVLLFAQADNAPLQLSEHEIERLDFNTRDFVAEHKLEAKGVSFFRQKWDSSVSKIYEEVLQQPEPRYGRPPKMDTYVGRPPKYEIV